MSLQVQVGDRVHILNRGPATVTRVTPDGGFDVKLQGRGEFHYSKNGTSGASQRQEVFYHDPVFVYPCQNQQVWGAYIRAAAKLYEEFKSLGAQGVFDGTEN